MTLAIAWHSEGRIHLASDSRIKLGDGKFADVGIKVLAVPVLVTDTGLGNDGGISVLFKSTFGLAYAGSLVNAGTFCELIAELLQHVQYVRADGRLSFITICDFMVDYCSRISTEVCAYMEQHGQYEFLLAGYCPDEKGLRAAKFSFAHESGRAKATYEEILRADRDFVAIGSGSTAATKRVKAVDFRSMLLTLNEVIDSQEVASVGGDLQYGSFGKFGEFSVSGIIRKTIETVTHEGQTYGPSEQRLFKYRGFQLYDNWNPVDMPLWVTTSFIELDVPSNAASEAFYRRRIGLPPA